MTPAMKEKRCEGKPGPYCGHCLYKDAPFVPGSGPEKASTMVLGESPQLGDTRKGRSFTGMPGKRLQKQMGWAKLFLSGCWTSHVVKCYVAPGKGGKKRTITAKAIRCCRPLLEDEMAQLKPERVVTLGAKAFSAFYDGELKNYHGARIQTEDYELVPMFKPDAFEEQPNLLRTIRSDWVGLQGRRPLEPVVGRYRLGAFETPPSDRYGVDTETTGLDLRSALLGMSVALETGDAVYTLAHECPQDRHWPGHAVMHNAKFDLGILESNGVSSIGSGWEDVDDTLLLAYVMNREPLGLKPLSIQELGLEQVRFKDVAEGKTLVGVDPERVAQYACGDADLTLRLWDHLWARASARERWLYESIEKPLPPLFARMQLDGVLVDVDYFEGLGVELEKKLKKLVSQLRSLDGCRAFTPEVLSSPTQLGRALSELLRWRVVKTDKFALEKLRSRYPAAIDLISEWKESHKLKTAFVDSLLRLHRGGLVFPNFNQAKTSTGRMTCEGPNLQQLPKKTKTVREGFPAPEGYLVATIDNSQIDLRSLAYLSQDERRIAKTANFLVVFGGGAGALAMKTGADEEVAYNFMDAYWDRHPGVKSWVDETHQKLSRDGFVETVYGRRRYIPKVYTQERGAAFREAQNMPVQGTSADILKLQTLAVSKTDVGALPFGQIHDEIDFYVPEGGWKDRVRELVRAMESVDCPFDLRVEASIGPNLGDQEKVTF
jgi:DNA polymerase-1